MKNHKAKIDYLNNIIDEPLDIMRFLRESEDLRDDICPSVGKEIGNFLYFMAINTNSKRIVEVGTSIGYSTSWLGLAAKKINGHVTTIEISERLINEAKFNLKLLDLDDNITFIKGRGEKVINELPDEIDMIFIDGATKSYLELYEISLSKLKKGGLLIFEDILFSVSGKREIQKEMMNDFNIKIKNDNRIEKSFLNIGDGLLLCLKR
ncbi:MAG: O-methyltransferase [Firmicutes bacterium]|nr:O-methyltransferase [Bacillota bacterium]